jgi:hypothetical protein
MPASPAPLIMVEFNELTPGLMHEFMSAGSLPHFKRFHDESDVFTTDAEAEGEDLNPWVQWVTVHSGLSAAAHGVRWLSEGHKLQAKAIWDFLSEAGRKVWVCGSMNARYDRPLNGCLLPDPWSTGLSSFPAGEFDDYYDFVRSQVQEHTNKSAPLAKGAAARFGRFMLRHGLSLGTSVALAKQLVAERISGGKWKRAVLLDRLQWDVFRHYYRKLRPDFSTFFLNSTAHFQHSYWRNMDPSRFAVRPTEAENREYGGAIRYGYQQMDALVGRFLRLAGRDATLVFCTGLSQQPYLKAEAKGGRHYYRLIGRGVLTDPLGIVDPFEFDPVMSDQALLRFSDAAARERAETLLATYRVKDNRAFSLQPDGANLMVQCAWTRPLESDAELKVEGTGRTVPFFKVFYSMDVIKSGFHHPDGMLWVRRPDRTHRVHPEKVSLRSIAPIVLRHFDLPIPESMAADRAV